MMNGRVIQNLLTGRPGALKRPYEKWEAKKWQSLSGQELIFQSSLII